MVTFTMTFIHITFFTQFYFFKMTGLIANSTLNYACNKSSRACSRVANKFISFTHTAQGPAGASPFCLIKLCSTVV